MFLPDKKFFLREIFLITVSVLSGVMAAFFMNVLYDLNLPLAPISTILLSMLFAFVWALITIFLLYFAQSFFEKNKTKFNVILEMLTRSSKKPEEGKIAGAGQGKEKKPT